MPSRPSSKAAAKPATKRARRDTGDAEQQAAENKDVDELAVQMFAALNHDAFVDLSDDGEGHEGGLDPDGVAGHDQLTRAEWLAMRRLVATDLARFDQQVRRRLDNGDPDNMESAALDALHGPDVPVAPEGEAPAMSKGLQVWLDESEHIRDIVKMLREGARDAPGGRFGYNMSLVQHQVDDDTEIDFVHWTNFQASYGHIVRLDKNNAMKSLVPAWDPRVHLQDAEMLIQDVGERGDRRRDRTIRIQPPPKSLRLYRMMHAALGDGSTSLPCSHCGSWDDADNQDCKLCALCLLAYHPTCQATLLSELDSCPMQVPPITDARANWANGLTQSDIVCEMCKKKVPSCIVKLLTSEVANLFVSKALMAQVHKQKRLHTIQ